MLLDAVTRTLKQFEVSDSNSEIVAQVFDEIDKDGKGIDMDRSVSSTSMLQMFFFFLACTIVRC